MNKYIENIKESASIELMIKAKELKASGVDVIDLSGGEPDFDTPEPVKAAVIEEIKRNNTHYLVGKGLEELRIKISKKLITENKIDISPNEIIVTPGAKMAIYLAIRSVVNEGDEVIVPTPSWVSYTEIIKASGAIPVEMPLNSKNDYSITHDLLNKHITEKTKAIILCSPNNPTGHIICEKELSIIKETVIKNNMYIISDEIYEKIVYGDYKVISPAADKDLFEHTITINGFSKAYAMTGWRLGYLASSSNLIQTINKLFVHTITGTPSFIQFAAVKAFDCQEYVEKMRLEFEERKKYFLSSLQKIEIFDVIVPKGAFYAWVKVKGVTNPSDYILKNAKVVCVPGKAYGESYDNYVRFSFATSMNNLQEAVKRLQTMDSTIEKR